MTDKESKNGWWKKKKNQMTDSVIGKSKWLTQNKKWLIKKAKMDEEKNEEPNDWQCYRKK
jgi:hypothetical protein